MPRYLKELDGFKAGDVVRVKTWDELAAIYPVKANPLEGEKPFIKCPNGCSFVESMREFSNNIYEIAHFVPPHFVSLKGNFKGFSFTTEMIETSTRKIREVKCANCGHVIRINRAIKSATGTYVCQTCVKKKDYYTHNDIRMHRQRNNGHTYGFELECVPISPAHKVAVINSRYHLIPTDDGSLPPYGVEFKTPTYEGLYSLRMLFSTFAKHLNFSSPQCGQHINIGCTGLNQSKITAIKNKADDLFQPLYYYMTGRQKDTERICGRYFTYYANKTWYGDHCSWINFQHNNRIEFRLSKFVTPDQYFELTCMWTEIFDKVLPYGDCYYHGDVHKTAHELVDIFKKYVSGSAKCQQRKKISKTA